MGFSFLKIFINMSKNKGININFPFKDSLKGFYLDLTVTDEDAIKADLMHLILTQKGTRYYLPNFGTNLLKFIFEPNDNITLGDIKQEIKDVVTRYLPNLRINEIKVEQSEEVIYAAIIRIDYTITDDVYEADDFILIKL